MRTLVTMAVVFVALGCSRPERPAEPVAEPAAAPPPSRPGRILIVTGDKDPSAAEAKLAALVVPPSLVAAPGWPRVLDSSTVPGLNPGFHIVALGMCQTLAPYDRELEDGRSLYFQWEHHDHLVAQMKAALPGSYAKDVEAAHAACPGWRGPRPEGAAAAAWERLGTAPNDVAALLVLLDEAGDPDTATYFVQRVLQIDPENEDALSHVGG